MEFELTEEHRMFQKLARDFAVDEIEPVAEEIEKEGRVPDDMLRKLADDGLLGITATQKYGGLQAGFLTYVLAVEQLHYPCTPCSWLAVGNEFADVIGRVGTESQQVEFLPAVIEGRQLPGVNFVDETGGTGLAGSDIVARRDGDGWVINGTQRLHVFGRADGPAIVLARTGETEMTAFVVSKNAPGYASSKPIALLGLRGLEVVDTSFENMRVSAGNLLGKPGGGHEVAEALAAASGLRQSIQAVACAQRALDEAVRYSRERSQRGAPIASMQAIQWLLAEMSMRAEPARWSTYQAAWLKDQGKDISTEAALSKLFAARVAKEVANMAIQVHGCYGLTKDYRIERIYRQAKMFELTEGSKETQLSVVSDALVAS